MCEWLQLLNPCRFLTDEPWSLFHYKPFLRQPLVRSIYRGRCCSKNCFPWRLSVFEMRMDPAGWLWRSFVLASWLSVHVCLCVSLCVACLSFVFIMCCACVSVSVPACHVWPCVVCLHQYTFTVVFTAVGQTTPESRVCLLSFFYILLQGTAATLHTQSFLFLLSLWVFNPLSDILKAANFCPTSTNYKKSTFWLGCTLPSSQLQSNVYSLPKLYTVNGSIQAHYEP